MTGSSPSPEATDAAKSLNYFGLVKCSPAGHEIDFDRIARALDDFARQAVERAVREQRERHNAYINSLMPADPHFGDVANALDAIRSLSGTAPQSGWRPIETAPKDGTYILLGAPSGYSTTPMRAHIGRWGTTYKVDRWITHSNDDFTDDGCPPTHWMPLPSPPTEDATG